MEDHKITKQVSLDALPRVIQVTVKCYFCKHVFYPVTAGPEEGSKDVLGESGLVAKLI